MSGGRSSPAEPGLLGFTILVCMDNSYLDGSHYDRETVAFYDVAHEGAQVRTVAGVLDQLGGLYGLNPRSVIILPTDQISRAAARFVGAMRSPLRLPVVVTDVLPGYVGALDIVVAVGADADHTLEEFGTAAGRPMPPVR